jgi:hypothetical protein
MNLLVVAAIVFLLNIPFGFWRAQVKKFSWQWILAIHLPVPIVVALRIYGDIGWHWITFPVLIGAFFSGQFSGAKLGGFIGKRRQLNAQ